jgi:ubiquinone/menaquinone biosynthesis C-methylase UbiE
MKSQDAHFDDIAEEYDSSIPLHVMAHLTTRRVDLAHSLVPNGKVLDVGCGTGRFLESLPPGYERSGVDVSLGMLEIAREKGLDVTQAGGENLPFEEASTS